jgi:hypothetical protein
MRLRRSIATLFTVTALFSGGSTLTACGSDSSGGNEDSVEEDTGNDVEEDDEG